MPNTIIEFEKNMNRIDGLQILRGIAALWVVLFHANGAAQVMGIPVSSFLDAIGKFGYVGVDLFFVISGFVIYYSVHNRPQSPGQFLLSRSERIIPPYVILTLLFSLLLFVMKNSANMQTPPPALDFLATSLLFLSFAHYNYPVIYVGWTLEYEMYFYLLASVSLVIGVRFFRKIPLILCLIVGAGHLIAPADKIVSFLTNPLLFEFAAGFVLAKLFLSGRKMNLDLALLAVTYGLLAVNDATGRIAATGLPCIAVVALVVLWKYPLFSFKYAKRALCFLGDASYSIYLIQVLSLPVMTKLFKLLWPSVSGNLFSIIGVGATVIAGIAFYLLIERPTLRFIRSRRNVQTNIAQVAGG